MLNFLRPKNAWHTSELDAFVSKCDKHGGVQHQNAADLITGFELRFDTKIDCRTDANSGEYRNQQIKLYEEISARTLNQIENEQADVPDNINLCNPYGSTDISFVEKHARTILNALMLADLKEGAWVLDVGCGWGSSTEVIAYAGANVHAIDINPKFVELVDQRCKVRSMSVRAEVSEFDTFRSELQYDMIFFYECLHHSTSVVRTLRHLSSFVKDDGCIVFAGEPITSAWWKDWGMRLDPLSVYCMRKYGWFETGWSEDYIKSAFDQIDWKLWLIAGIGLDHGYIGLALPKSAPDSELMRRVSKVIPAHWATVL